MKIEQLLYIVV